MTQNLQDPSGASHAAVDQREVFAFLADRDACGIAEPVVRIDTHGAVVFLAGPDVYKVKRAVRFPFLDYSTLEKRRIACEAEVAINRPHAPDLYLGVVPIRKGSQGFTLGRDGEVVEWAVHMRRFDLSATLDRVWETGPLRVALVVDLARAIRASHERAPLRQGAPFITSLGRYIADNEAAFRETPELFPPDRVHRLTARSFEELESTRALLSERGEQGFVRRCHGDLHLANIVLLEGKPVLFDAIEFDDAIATGDVLYDLAFVLMDLWDRKLHDSANALLNRYLWESAEKDLGALAALPLFLSVRAAIRAKVTAARATHLSGEKRERALRDAARYFECAEDVLRTEGVRVVAVGGLSGTGKTTLASAIAPGIGRPPGAVHLRSDIERKRMFDVPETEKLPAEAYRPEVSAEVYDRLLRKASLAARAGYSVVVDAVHARPEERRRIEALARELDIAFTGLWLEAPVDLLRERVTLRRGDASDADAAVVDGQAARDIGPLDWHRLDAAGDRARMTAAARAIVGGREAR